MVLLGCTLPISYSTHTALALQLMVFRVSPRALIPGWQFYIREALKKRRRWQCRLPAFSYLSVRDIQGNSCPHTLLFAQPRTLLQYPVLREFIAFSHHLPAEEWRTLGLSEGRSCVLSAVHDTPEAALSACAGQPVQHSFSPPAPSCSVITQCVLPMKSSELKYVMMAFVVPLAHAPSTDRPTSW